MIIFYCSEKQTARRSEEIVFIQVEKKNRFKSEHFQHVEHLRMISQILYTVSLRSGYVLDVVLSSYSDTASGTPRQVRYLFF